MSAVGIRLHAHCAVTPSPAGQGTYLHFSEYLSARYPGHVCLRDEARDAAQVLLEVHCQEWPHRDTCPGSCAPQHPEASHRPALLQRFHQEAWRHSLPHHRLPRTGQHCHHHCTAAAPKYHFGPQKHHFVSKKTPISYCIIKLPQNCLGTSVNDAERERVHTAQFCSSAGADMDDGVQITDAMLHPQTASALVHSVKVPWATFRKTFPLYMSISLVPYVVSPHRQSSVPLLWLSCVGQYARCILHTDACMMIISKHHLLFSICSLICSSVLLLLFLLLCLYTKLSALLDCCAWGNDS